MTDTSSAVSDLDTLVELKDERPEVVPLLASLKRDLPALETLLAECDDHFAEDCIYRFYHGSFKVYFLQDLTERIVEQLRQVMPERELDAQFQQILREGTGLTFTKEHNRRWLDVTSPFVEAFFHTRDFLEMAVTNAPELDSPRCLMPSGWAARLHLYRLR